MGISFHFGHFRVFLNTKSLSESLRAALIDRELSPLICENLIIQMLALFASFEEPRAEMSHLGSPGAR